jgi:hypothetical protein
MKRIPLLAVVAAAAALLLAAVPAGATTANTGHTAGFYDHQIIEYEGTAQVTASPQAAQQLSQGLIVYHVVGVDGTPPAVQCARLRAALPADASDCNVLNRIPTDPGYTGGAWNLQVFHWAAGVTPVELSQDDQITDAAAAGLGWIEVTNILVRCPVINFAALR